MGRNKRGTVRGQFRQPSIAEAQGLRADGFCHVAVPLGIGDAHWAMMKLRALKERDGRPLCVHINESTDHATVGYLRMMPFVDKAICSPFAPYGLPPAQLPPSHLDDKWATLDGSRAWNGLDYVFVPNGWLERGRHLRDWMPDLATEWDVEVEWTDAERERSLELMPEPTVLLYLSGTGPNTAFHGDTWTVDHWARLVLFLNAQGIRPACVGAPTEGDMGYWRKAFLAFRRFGADVVPLVGQTTIPDYLLLIKRARAWVGLNSGGGIVSASMGSPTLMFWYDNRYPVGAPHLDFDTGFQRSWIDDVGDPSKRETYRTLCYGSPELTPEGAAAITLEIAR